jgi:alpha-glucosidase (family GH31 glycosyl hydrolase)
MSHDRRVILDRHRFTCLAPGLVRLEFAPDGVFEKRPSIVAAAFTRPRRFVKHTRDGDRTVLDTGRLAIRRRDGDRAFSRHTLELRWIANGLLQSWRPGDRDPRNLGGTVRSLDGFNADARIDGVHTADLQHPDAKGLQWLNWLKCEEDPAYFAASPRAVEPANGRHWHAMASAGDHGGRLLERSLNATIDAHRYGVGVLSRSGYFLLNDSDSAVLGADGFPEARDRPGYQDWYFFAYGSDYRQALRDFVLLTGRAPLPTRNTFGIIFSRWPAYGEEEAMTLVETFRAKGYPLSTLVLDMEWHREGWGNWDWNDALYPAPKRFMRWCRAHGIEVTLNDHPNDVREDDSHFDAFVREAGPDVPVRELTFRKRKVRAARVNICNPRVASAFVKTCHAPVRASGMDYWWNDGCRGELDGATAQLAANKLFFEEVETRRRRGMLLARYGGLGSHRYGVTFTGDTASCWEVLKLQCEFNIRAGHVGLAYVSHDIGGFTAQPTNGRIDPDLYLRWLQFGVFSPVLRFHSAPGSGSRRPWDYDMTLRGAARRWLRVRNSLLPYIYTAAREHHDSGVPLVRGLFLDDPGNRDAYRFDQYMFGPHVLVAPVLGPERRRTVYLPEGTWYDFESCRKHTGGRELAVRVPRNSFPVFVRAGAVIPRQNPDAPPHGSGGYVTDLVLDVYPGTGGGTLYEDDGKTPRYRRAGYCRTAFTLSADANGLRLRGRRPAGQPLAARRRVRVRLAVGRMPAGMRFRGRELDAKAHTAQLDDGRCEIDLGEQSCRCAFLLDVRWKELCEVLS